jgi:hypothetical protein
LVMMLLKAIKMANNSNSTRIPMDGLRCRKSFGAQIIVGY